MGLALAVPEIQDPRGRQARTKLTYAAGNLFLEILSHISGIFQSFFTESFA